MERGQVIGAAHAVLGLTAALLLAGCERAATNNAAVAVNVAAEEGVVDLNSSIEGDQYSPLPEAADDFANRSVSPSGNAAAPPR